MSFRAVFWLVVWLALLWGGFLVVRHGAAVAMAAAPERMVPATLVVTNSGCSKSEGDVLWSCEAEGAIEAPGRGVDGAAGTLRWESENGHYIHTGERAPVLVFDPPALPAALSGLFPGAVVPAGEDARAAALTELAPDLRALAYGLTAVLAAVVLHLAGRLLRARGPDRLELEHFGSTGGCTFFLLGVGVPLLALGVGAATLWGLGLVALAGLVELRRFVVVDRRAGTLVRGWQLFVLRRKGAAKPLGEVTAVVRHGDLTGPRVSIRTGEGDEEVLRTHDHARLARDTRRLAELLRAPVVDAAREEKPSKTAEALMERFGIDEATLAEAAAKAKAPSSPPPPVVPATPGPVALAAGGPVTRLTGESGGWKGCAGLVGGCAVLLALVAAVLAVVSASSDGGLAAWWRETTGAAEEAPAEPPPVEPLPAEREP